MALPRPGRLTLAAFCALGAALVPALAHADAPGAPAPPKLGYWADTTPRWFVAGRLEGGLYLKPQIFLGYGQPHWIWAGVEAYPVTTATFAGGYAGLRFSLPIFDVKLGVRDSFSFNRSYLAPKAAYVASDVSHAHDHPHVRYTTAEGTLNGVVPLPGSYLILAVDAYYLPDVPAGFDMYEEALRVVTRAPWLVGSKLAYVVRLGENGFIKVGGLGEAIAVPKRDAVTLRVGPAGLVNLTDHLDLLFALSLPVASPDRLGIFEGSWGVLGVSYAWATGDEHPHFP
jgi:hypothetical protein